MTEHNCLGLRLWTATPNQFYPDARSWPAWRRRTRPWGLALGPPPRPPPLPPPRPNPCSAVLVWFSQYQKMMMIGEKGESSATQCDHFISNSYNFLLPCDHQTSCLQIYELWGGAEVSSLIIKGCIHQCCVCLNIKTYNPLIPSKGVKKNIRHKNGVKREQSAYVVSCVILLDLRAMY